MTNRKKYDFKENNVWWISILFVAIIFYGYGIITVKYHTFPYRQLKYFQSLIITDTKKQPRIKSTSIASSKGEPRSYNSDRQSFFDTIKSNADIVMIGDSITDTAEWKELFPNISIINRSIAGDTTKGVLDRLASIYSTKAKKAFIMIGINDLSKNISEKEILSNYEKIVVQLKQHGIKPYIQSLLLTGGEYAYFNKDIIRLNLNLRELAKKENIDFIDLNQVFAKNGKRIKFYSSADDVHLNGEGYLIWKNYINKYLD